MLSPRYVFSFALLAIATATTTVSAQRTAGTPRRIDPRGISGSLVIAGGGSLPAEVYDEFLKLAGGDEAKIVVIPTASRRADEDDREEVYLTPWRERGSGSVVLLHTRSTDRANDLEFIKPLENATGVWFSGGAQSRIAEAYLGTKVEQAVYDLLARDGVVGGSSAGAAIQSRVMIASGNPEPNLATGLDLLPDAILDQHFRARRREPRLRTAVAQHSARFGLGIDEKTAIIVRGRRVRVVGQGGATVVLAKSESCDPLEFFLESGRQIDLTGLRRAARERHQPRFPRPEIHEPLVNAGSLVIVGGGGLNNVAGRFIDLAGGAEAPIIVLPTASSGPIRGRSRDAATFRQNGAKNVYVWTARTIDEVEDPAALKRLEQARGVWFSGGRQWRFVDAYENTKAYPAFHQVLARGGVIGGSSAGASIQAEFMVRGSPLGNREMMALGYTRGFNFLPGVAIDQHFTQRNRFADLSRVIRTHPQLLGIGIDERTAVIVQGHRAEVAGEGRAHFYDQSPSRIRPYDYQAVPSGGAYDLKARRVLSP